MDIPVFFSSEAANALLVVLAVGIPVLVIFLFVNKTFKNRRQLRHLQKELNEIGKD